MSRVSTGRQLVRMLPLVGALLLPVAPAAQARTVVLTGTVRVAHADDLQLSRTTARYVVDTARGSVEVRRAPGVRWYPETGDIVRVTGERRGDVVIARRVVRRGANKRLLGGTPVTGTHRVAVILVNFSDRTATPYTRELLEQRYFTNADSVAAYYAEQSFGKLSITGDVYDWHTIAATSTTCSYTSWATAARAAAGLSGSYDHYVYVFPQVPSCYWAGLAYLPGNESFINGSPSLRVMGHELGHNLGVHHASTLDCYSGAARVTLSATCDPLDEYGDPFSIMGNATSFHFSAFHKAQLGWLDAANEQDATVSGSYTVARSSSASSGVQSLRIRRSASQWIYCDLRSTNGGPFEVFAGGSPATQGVMLRVGPAYSIRTQPQLLDATPASPTFGDAALLPGQSFMDPVSGVRITAGALGAEGATLQVDLAGAGDVSPPSLPGALATVAGSGSIQLSWEPATDDRGVTAYRVYRDGALIGSPTATAWNDPGPPAGAIVTYAVAAVDAAGNEGPRRAALVSVPTPPPTAPSGLAAAGVAGGSVRLGWAAAAGAVRYSVVRDGAPVLEVERTDAVDTGLEPGSSHAYAVVAIDVAGRRSNASETVVVTLPTDVLGRGLDATPPGSPGRLTAQRLVRKRIRLAWRAAADDVRVAHYRVERNGRVILRTTARAAIVRLAPGATKVTLVVRAVDAAGNVGRPARIVVRPRG